MAEKENSQFQSQKHDDGQHVPPQDLRANRKSYLDFHAGNVFQVVPSVNVQLFMQDEQSLPQ